MPTPPVNVEKLLPCFRRAALAAPVAALDGWWLDVRCPACRGSTSCPLHPLIPRHGRRTLAGLVARLRCKQCGRPPLSVQLTDDIAAGSIGALPPTWRLELLPLDPPDRTAPRLRMVG